MRPSRIRRAGVYACALPGLQMAASSSTAAAVAVSGSAAPVPAGASAAAGVVAPGAATSSSHVFVLKADLMKLSCDARASPYVINIDNFGGEWLRYPDSLRTAQKYVRERGRVYWDSSHRTHPNMILSVRTVHTAHNSTSDHPQCPAFVRELVCVGAATPPPMVPALPTGASSSFARMCTAWTLCLRSQGPSNMW